MSKSNKLTVNPFAAKLNNSFVNLRGEVCHNLDKSRSKVALQIKVKRSPEYLEQQKKKAEDERLQKLALKKGLWIILGMRTQARNESKTLDNARNETLKAAMMDPADSQDLFHEAAAIAAKVAELRLEINDLQRLLNLWDRNKKQPLVDFVIVNNLLHEQQSN